MTRIDKIEMMGFKSFSKKTTITLPDNFTVICGPNGSGKSARYDTQIPLTNGEMKPIGEIVENSIKMAKSKGKLDDGVLTFENPYGYKVWVIEPNTMKIIEKDIRAFIKRKGEPHLYKTITRTGLEIITTGCHPVMTFDGNSVVSKKIDQLNNGDMIATPNKLEFIGNDIKLNINNVKKGICNVSIPNKLNANLARFMGYLIGDGHIRHDRCELVNNNKIIINDFTKLSASIFNKNPNFNYSNKKSVRAIINSVEICDFIHKLTDQDKILSHNKMLPDNILFAKKEVFVNALASLFDCDGTVDKNKTTIEYSSKSKILIDQIRFLLLRLGITCKVKSKLKCASNTEQKTKKRYYYITIDGIKNLRNFYKDVPMKHNKKIARLKKHANKKFIPQRTYEEVLPKEVNKLIIECRKLLGIEYKPLRKRYPSFAAYNENRCYPTKEGIQKINKILKEKVTEIEKIQLKSDKNSLIEAIDILNIKRRHASKSVGMGKDTINNSWIHNNWQGKEENREKIYDYIQKEIKARIKRSREIIKILYNLANSDILWDKIVKIKKVKGEKWVYDLEISDCHNFMGNGIFIHNSNVLDAICFVLGRTSAKSLRADKMLEVIFNGGASKEQAEFAKVKLFFDNTDKMFPVEEDTLEVSRKVNAKGISIYKMNGKTITREFMLEILRKAHIFPDGHNIILQGDVTEIIEMSSRERREIIDEVSGIREFDQKREKAQKELEIVSKRLENSAAVLGEKDIVLKRLEIERRSAKEHKTLSSELDKLRGSLAKVKMREAEEAMKKLNEKLEKGNTKEIDDEIKKIDTDLEKLEKEKSNISKKVFERKDIDIIKEAEKLKNDINLKTMQIEKNKFEMQQLDEITRKTELLQGDSDNRVVSSILKLNRSGVYGTIANLTSVPKEYQSAIEVTAGNHLNDIVTHDKDIAIECINYLKQNKIGRTAFLPLDKIRPRDDRESKKLLDEDGVVGLAIDLLTFDNKYHNAFSFIFGDTLIVKTIEHAKRIGVGKARFVTLDGDLVEKSGAIIGGFYRPDRRAVLSDTSSYQKRKKQLGEDIIKLNLEIDSLAIKLKEISIKEQSGTKEFLDTRKQIDEIEVKLNQLRTKRRSLYDKKTVLEQDNYNSNINRARLEAALANIRSEFEIYKNLETYDMKPEVLEPKINETLRKINSLGLINMRALEEYDREKLVFDDMKSRVDKLVEERDRVFGMITEVEGKRKECFTKTFEVVAVQFKKVFYDLTRGVGILALENPEDIESGLIIQANPAGKKLLNIDLMSGGEKTLTALAFLFAVQQFKPAPFYILDEIDAALDKPNTKKITELIKKYRDMAEFIVITHNDSTIQAADVVYGVTMDKGESNLVSIRMPGA